MIKIQLSAAETTALLERHKNSLTSLVRNRLNQPRNRLLKDHFTDDLKIAEVLTVKPGNMLILNSSIITALRINHTLPDIVEALKLVFNEDRFFSKKRPKYNAYDLCRSLGLNTCPYCNIQPTKTVCRKEMLYRPPLDHFFASSLYPMLSMSFFNLIPACGACNTTFKLNHPTNLTTHLHPYLEGFDDTCQFTFTGYKNLDAIYSKKPGSYALELYDPTGDLRYKGNRELFELDSIYATYKVDAAMTLGQARKYSKAQVNSILKTVHNSRFGAYQQLFKTLYPIPELSKFPLSKLNRDIVRQYARPELKTLLNLT